jgi:predicted metal-dependent hydrolase
MSELDQVRYGNSTIRFAVLRSARRKKTIAITLDPVDGILVAAPVAASAEVIRAVVYKRASWILTRADEGVLHPKPKLFVSGETLPYLGREVRMDVTHGDVPAVRIRFSHWAFDVTVPSRLDGDERRTAIRSAFVKWYRRRAADAVRRSVARWSERLPVAPKGAVIRDQRQRWGSCGPDGMLRFNWRIVMSAPDLLDYVVVHELAHLVHRNHSREFWGTVEGVMPDYRLRRQRLKEVGARLSL